ncbi:hypothetical protein AMTR_s00021p00053210 [Amborella trichopoda]|uniref:Uncharacterized protein n=1 Tax=Amborella trichopoda TaxID=13333 RepID=W1Q072_AMBTC|nr:hypothetical protein AMTR_s00021p00053210 [Amborella trichopoda]
MSVVCIPLRRLIHLNTGTTTKKMSATKAKARMGHSARSNILFSTRFAENTSAIPKRQTNSLKRADAITICPKSEAPSLCSVTSLASTADSVLVIRKVIRMRNSTLFPLGYTVGRKKSAATTPSKAAEAIAAMAITTGCFLPFHIREGSNSRPSLKLWNCRPVTATT